MSEKKRKLVVFSGAGMSAESGISTFRDSGGLWEKHSIEEVATPQAFGQNPKKVLEFYNHRRRQLYEVEPNEAHYKIAELDTKFDTTVITQNVDNLHERAGSERVLHLHGELDKGRSSVDETVIVDLKGKDINLGDKAPDGSQLRPHVVWFGEAVPAMNVAMEEVQKAEILIVVGTSLQVYPAAGLVDVCNPDCEIYYIDPQGEPWPNPKLTVIKEKASIGMKKLAQKFNL
jgi:NAD-dependent deacetylase